MESLKAHIDLENLPLHVAVIMDGNGRWAKMHGKPRVFGSEASAPIRTVRANDCPRQSTT